MKPINKPVRDTFLPYGKQWIDEEDIEAVNKVLRSNYITTGPMVEEFEKGLAAYVGSKYAVTFSNGTAALHGACFAAGIESGDEVITSPMTFVASANCVLYQGATPVFADIDNESYNINPEKVAEHISNKTKAIIPVHFSGQPVNLNEINKLAEEHNLVVIEDAAHALGSRYQNRKVGSISDMTMFSFHPVKHITTGEGGVIATNNVEYYEKLIQFRSHGITRIPELLKKDSHGPWYYEMHYLGYNYRLTDIQAALGLSQLSKLDKFISLRRKYAELYNNSFSKLEAIVTPFQREGSESSWHIYVLRLKLEMLTVGRKQVFEDLLKENIGVNVHYIPVYLQPYYQQLGYPKGLCPIAEKLYEEIITLPLHPQMTEQDAQDVIRAVEKVVTRYSK